MLFPTATCVCPRHFSGFIKIFKNRIKFLLKFRPDNDLIHLNSNTASVWVKIVSSWMCIIIYTWTLIAPALFPDRDFN